MYSVPKAKSVRLLSLKLNTTSLFSSLVYNISATYVFSAFGCVEFWEYMPITLPSKVLRMIGMQDHSTPTLILSPIFRFFYFFYNLFVFFFIKWSIF